MKKVKWKQGARFKCSPGAAHRFFENNRQENDGAINWKAAEKAARLKGCPVHNDLEWDDKTCGQKYRIDQLQRMARRIEVVRPEIKAAYRAYETVSVDVVPDKLDKSGSIEQQRQQRVWSSTEEILADPAGRADLLSRAVKDAIAFRKRYAILSELAQLIEVIDEEIAKLAK